MTDTAQHPVDATANDLAQTESPIEEAVDTWRALEQRTVHLLQLVAAELRLAASSGAWIGALTIVAGGLMLSCWLTLLATIGVLAANAGVSLVVICLSAAALNLLAAVIVGWLIYRLSQYLTMPHLRATRAINQANGEQV